MGLEAGLNGWSGGAGKVGRLVIARMRSWAPLKAVGRHSNIQNGEPYLVKGFMLRNIDFSVYQ